MQKNPRTFRVKPSALWFCGSVLKMLTILFFFELGFILCKAEKSLQIVEIQEKEDKDEKDIGKEYKEKRCLLTLD